MDLDVEKLSRLPLPMGQLYRRAHNSTSPLARHQAAYYLWEAGIKLLASTAIAKLALSGTRSEKITRQIDRLTRPSLGDWSTMAVTFSKIMADRDPGFAAVTAQWNRRLSELHHSHRLNDLLHELLLNASSGKSLFALLENVIAWRTAELGHGAAGLRKTAVYERLAPALLDAALEYFGVVDVLAGSDLLFVKEVHKAADAWLIYRFQLHGESPTRINSIEIPSDHDAPNLPNPGCVYLVPRTDPEDISRWCPMHPMLSFDLESTHAFFLNSRRGASLAFLCYTTGEEKRDGIGDLCDLIATVQGVPVAQVMESQSAADVAAASGHDEYDEFRTPAADGLYLGEFRLLSRLGAGGMGVVYRAYQPSLHRQVAVKRLTRTNDASSDSRFRREIKALARADHPNLIKIFSSGEEGDVLYYSMELVDGCDLCTVLEHVGAVPAAQFSGDTWRNAITTAVKAVRSREKPLQGSDQFELPYARLPDDVSLIPEGGQNHRFPLEAMVALLSQVADATQALHEVGVIHRDVKPANIMVSVDGKRAALMDLGIARLLDESEGRLTRTRDFVGTIRYASPEQILCSGEVDQRTDIYSLGATLWELLTLRPIHNATADTPDLDLRLRITDGRVESPRKYNKRIPKDVCAIVAKCLEKERSRRYQSARDLSDDINRFLSGDPVQAQPPSVAYSMKKFAARNVSLLATAGIVLVALAALLFGYIHSVRDSGRRAREALVEKNRVLALSQLTLGSSRMDSGRESLGIHSLLMASELIGESDPLSEQINQVLAHRLASLPDLLPNLEPGLNVSFSGDSRVVAISGHSWVSLWDATSGRSLMGDRNRIDFPVHSWSGIAIALDHEGGLMAVGGQLVNTKDFRVEKTCSLEEEWVQLSFDNDSPAINMYARSGEVHRWQFDSAASAEPLLANPAGYDDELSFGVSANRKYFTRYAHGEVSLHAADSGDLIGQPLKTTGPVRCVPGDEHNVLVLSQRDAMLWNPTTSNTNTFYEGEAHTGSFDVDLQNLVLWEGDRIFTYSVRSLIWPRESYCRHPAQGAVITMSPDSGRCVMVGGGGQSSGAKLVDLTPGHGISMPLSGEFQVGKFSLGSFSDSGKTFGVLDRGYDSVLTQFWNTRSGGVLRNLEWGIEGGRRAAVVDGEQVVFSRTFLTLNQFAAEHPGYASVHTSHDGRTVATAGPTTNGNFGIVVKTASGETLLSKQYREPLDATLSGNGAVLAAVPQGDSRGDASRGGACRVWDLSQENREWIIANGIRDVAVNYSGSQIATVDDRGDVIVWTRSGSHFTKTPLDHGSAVTSLYVNRNSNRLLTGTQAGMVTLWNTDTMTPLTRPFRIGGPVNLAAIDDQDEVIVAFSVKMQSGELWRLPKVSTESIDELRKIAARKTLTRSEAGVPVPLPSGEWPAIFGK